MILLPGAINIFYSLSLSLLEIKEPGPIFIDPGCPCLSSRSNSKPLSAEVKLFQTFQAGLLTSGSSYSPCLPNPLLMVSDMLRFFVPGYSGGPVSDLHGVPFCAPSCAPDVYKFITEYIIYCKGKNFHTV